jgi:hypothetical protein
MRILFVLIAVLALAACASGSQPKSQARQGNAADVAARAPMMSKDDLENYISERAEQRLVEICGERRTISSQLTCVRDAILRGFDTTGEAERNCDADAPLEPMMHCVVIGSLGYELAIKADTGQASTYDWTDPEGAMDDVFEVLAEQTVSDCMSVALSKIDGCVMQKIGQSLALTDRVVTACTDDADSDKSLDCLVRAYVIQEFESAFQRMGPGPGQQV